MATGSWRTGGTMARYEVSPDQLRMLSDRYRREAHELQERLGRLSGETAALRADWVGGGASTFQSLVQSVDSNQKRLILTLEEMAHILARAASAYESADSNISSAFDQ